MTKKMDMDKVLEKAISVTEIPPIANRGRTARNYQPMIELAISKGIIRFSETDMPINSVVTGLKKALKLPENKDKQINITTRQFEGKTWLYLQKPFKKTK